MSKQFLCRAIQFKPNYSVLNFKTLLFLNNSVKAEIHSLNAKTVNSRNHGLVVFDS